MPIIYRYTEKDPVLGNDKLLGINGNNLETKNFEIDKIAEYILSNVTLVSGEIEEGSNKVISSGVIYDEIQMQQSQWGSWLASYDSSKIWMGFAIPTTESPSTITNSVYKPKSPGIYNEFKDALDDPIVVPNDFWNYIIDRNQNGYSIVSITDSINGNNLLESSISASKLIDGEISLSKFTQAVIDFIGSGGNVVNNPDDVDLETKSGSVIGLKDNNRNGYEVRTITQLNALTSGAVSGKYIIVSNITLTSDIVLPLGVELEFRNSIIDLYNYRITGNKTKINSPIHQIFDVNNGDLDGTWDVENVYPEWFGAVRDGVTDDVDKIRQGVSFASLNETTLRLSKGTYKINDVIGEIDFNKISLIGNRTLIDCSDVPSGVVVELYSSISYPHFKNITSTVEGIILRGSLAPGVIGLQIGNAISNENNDCVINRCVIDRFDTNVSLIRSAWRIKFINSAISRAGSYHIYAPDGINNYGECMTFIGCFIADGNGVIELNRGYFTFESCSIDNVSIKARSASSINLMQCHIENPAQATDLVSYYYVDCENSRVTLTNCNIVLNEISNGDPRSIKLFRCEDVNNCSYGLYINNSYLPQRNDYAPSEDTYFTYTDGDGHCEFNQIRTYGDVDNGGLKMPYSSKTQNELTNGDAELGNTSGWTTAGVGSVIADQASAKSGSFGFNLLNSVTFYQEVNVQNKIGKIATLGGQVKVINGNINIRMFFIDASGDILLQLNRVMSNTDWLDIANSGGMAHSIPKNTQIIRVSFNISEGTYQSYMDDIMLNII